MNIWILAKKEHKTLLKNKRFFEEAKQMEMTIKVIDPREIEIIEPHGSEQKVYYQNRLIDIPDAVIPRTGSGTTYFMLAVMRKLESLGCYLINSADSIEKAKDKLHTFQLLTQNNLPVPKTILARQPLNMKLIEKELNFPVVLKKVSSSMGTGLTLCENSQELEDVLGMIENEGQTPPLIIQEFINSRIGEDIRVIVIGGRAIGAMLRKGKEGSFKSNFSAGGTAQLTELTSELEWLATESAGALGLTLAGVDILFDKEGYKICEVNSNPGFAGFEPATGLNIAQEILKFIQLKTEGNISEIE